MDDVGDGSEWADHCGEHFKERFSPFKARNADLVITPIGIAVIESEGRVEFELGSGFDDAQPELHEDREDSLIISPAFCPWCVYDDALPMKRRMRQ